jgi:excisionase family DNA binding protein
MSARPTSPVAEWESLKHAAARTEFSEFTFRELVTSGKLPAYRINDRPGSAIRVRRADVDALFKPLIPSEVYPDRDGGAD